MRLTSPIELRPATAADWPAISSMLQALQLPLDGARDHLEDYLLALADGEVVGCAGTEMYGQVALMRSVAVAPGRHGQGIGRRLVSQLVHDARTRGVQALYLLTVAAPEYFTTFGFQRGPVDQAPSALRASQEFRGACPACAAFMRLPLELEGEPPVTTARPPQSAPLLPARLPSDAAE